MKKLSNISESMWGDIHRRNSGEVARKEDDVNFMDFETFGEYLRNFNKKEVTRVYLDPAGKFITIDEIDIILETKERSYERHYQLLLTIEYSESKEVKDIRLPYSFKSFERNVYSKMTKEFSISIKRNTDLDLNISDLDLNVVKNIAVPNLDAVKYWEVNGGIIKLELPDTINGEEIERAIFVNITNELVMQHRRIIAIPYSTPDFYIGFDNLEPSEYKKLGVEPPKEKNTYYFYDSDFNKILEVKADDYADLNKGKVLLFDRTQDGWKTKFVNLHECIVKDCPYDDIHFNAETQIGHGYNENTDMIDIFDKNLNLLFTNIDYKKYNIDRNRMNITYRVVNNNIIFQIQRGGYVLRNIIFDENNNILFDSTNHDCKLIGNLIEIRRFNDFEGDSTYLNTLTGDIGTLHVSQSDGALKLVMNGQKSILSSSELFLKDGN